MLRNAGVNLARKACAEAVVLTLVTAVPALPADDRWEVEVHGGYMASSNPAGGVSALPGLHSASAEVVPSWYFGDGALVLNQFLTSTRLNAVLEPLDAVLGSAFLERQSGAGFGIRIARILNSRFIAEATLDEEFGELAITAASRTGIQSTGVTFESAMDLVLNAPAGGSQVVESSASIGDSQGRQRFGSGTLLINLGSGRIKPYAAVGAGFVKHLNGAPEARLAGNYRFTYAPAVNVPIPIPIPTTTFHETDTVVIRTSVGTAFTGVFGAGFRYDLTDRLGVRVDVRDYISENSTATILAATPGAEKSAAGGATLSLFSTTGILRFSTVRGFPSTLGGSPVFDFTSFRGSGVRNQVKTALGLFW